jgi:hypothetical protein
MPVSEGVDGERGGDAGEGGLEGGVDGGEGLLRDGGNAIGSSSDSVRRCDSCGEVLDNSGRLRLCSWL